MATHEVTRPLALNVTALEIAQALQDIIVTLPVVDNLTTNDGSKALSAKMGKKLNDEKFPIANIASALGQDVDKVPSNKVVDDAINAITNKFKIFHSSSDAMSTTDFTDLLVSLICYKYDGFFIILGLRGCVIGFNSLANGVGYAELWSFYAQARATILGDTVTIL